ncbi:MAG: hypothetical protein J2P21_08990 [Chloracidobacterium sp.]|nr:hypothetical protein [Chloracidobacterium sp.]
MLVSYLTDKPFRYFDHIRIKTIDPSFKSYTDWSADDERSLREGVAVNPAGAFLQRRNFTQALRNNRRKNIPS